MTLKSDAKFEEKLICCFKNDKNLVNFDPSPRKSPKFAFTLVPFVHGAEELSYMTLKSDAKFEEKLTCGLENDTQNLANFQQSTRKSQNWSFDGILLSKVENLRA